MRDVTDSVMAALAEKRAADDIDALMSHCDAMEQACARIAAEVGCSWDADTVTENTKRVIDAIRERCK